jgi:hypothetical protein
MKFKYIKEYKRLSVYGVDADKDISEVKKLIAANKIPGDLSAIVYQKAKNSVVGSIIRGRYLENLLRPEDVPAQPVRPSLKGILQQINEANARQASHAGLLLYATNAKRFLLFTPRSRQEQVQLLGDNPRDGETPIETVCRVAREDGDFEITPNVLVSLIPLEINETTYWSFLCLVEREFKPMYSARIIKAEWKSYEAMEELNLHPSVKTLFDKDKKLLKLIKPIEVDFNQLIDEILHS